MSNKPKYKRGNAVVLPSYSLKNVKEGDSLFLRIDSDIRDKQKFQKDGVTPEVDEDGREKWLHLVDVTDLNTGETGEMVLPFLVKQALEKYRYTNPLTGATFELVKGKKKGRTDEWSVYDLILE